MDRNLIGVMRNFRPSVVYDIGANKGQWYNQHVNIWPDARFICFEANPQNNPQNFRLQDVWIDKALSNATQELFLHLPDSESTPNTGASFYKELTPCYSNGSGINVTTTTLDKAILDFNLPFPDLIKLDTQGSEVDIFEGALMALNAAKFVVTEIPVVPYNQDAATFDQYVSALLANDFVPTAIDRTHIRDGVVLHFDMVFAKRDIVKNIR